MKISKGTIVRTLTLLIVIVNIILERLGFDMIKTNEGTLLSTVEALIELCAIAAAWWYNNSFSQKALKAQEYLNALRKEEYNV